MTDRSTTIAILSHNRSWQLAQCLASIREFTAFEDYKIVILDTASELNHVAHVLEFASDDCRVIQGCEFYSCLNGRRALLEAVDTPYVAYLDDDLKVGDRWLTTMHRAIAKHGSGVAVGNIIQEGARITSGARNLVEVDGKFCVEELPTNFEGPCQLCIGGATLYETDVLRKTELRSEYDAGFEDWDQTLQITVDQRRTIAGCRATVFHNHQAENIDYFSDRWRWGDLMDAGIAMWDRWHIRTGVDNTLRQLMQRRITVPGEQFDRMREALT